ncbi:MAG TPA: zinc-binding dehydrogenase, partial [Thermomicrobiales bacterium]|nr:zinc-binding dehydrogenase [Thermomicrobiales bacterium]
GYAELALANVSSLDVIPDSLAADIAVAAIGTGRTAQMILDAAILTPKDVAIVTAAASGVGSLLVQSAHHLGATVIALAGGPEKVGLVRKLGTDIAIDYRVEGWHEGLRRYIASGNLQPTISFDGVGGDLGRAAFDLLGPLGRHIVFGWSSGSTTKISVMDLYDRSRTVTAAIGSGAMSRYPDTRPLETRALDAAIAGTAVPIVGQRFALADARDAHRAVSGRGTIGKTVLVP